MRTIYQYIYYIVRLYIIYIIIYQYKYSDNLTEDHYCPDAHVNLVDFSLNHIENFFLKLATVTIHDRILQIDTHIYGGH